MNPSQLAEALRAVVDGGESMGVRFAVVEQVGPVLEIEATWGDDRDQRFQVIARTP
jgi:hypothetical protein